MSDIDKYEQLCAEMDRLTHESMHPDPLIAQIPIIERKGVATAMAIMYPQQSKYDYIRRSERRVRGGKSYFMGDN